MNPKLRMLRFATSDKVKKQQIGLLMECAEKSFGVKAPVIRNLSYQESLGAFASYTHEQAELSIGNGTVREVKQKLYENAFELAQKVRKGLSIRKPEEALYTLVTLYENIGITVEGELPGELCFRRCYFSEIYSPETCDVISAFDSGVCGGLMNGGSVTFSERITEGHSQCRACYCEKEFTV